MTVRPASSNDVPGMAALSGVLGYVATPSAFDARLQRVLSRAEDIVLVADLDRQVVGWLHGSEQPLLTSDRSAEILALVVDGTQRRRGVGRQLIAAFEAWCSARGIVQVCVRSNVVRPESHAFYERLGYDRVKSQHVYRKPVPPAAR
jgi:GNAT superfamily N-acetyltransferase